jgi:hypothetical protein
MLALGLLMASTVATAGPPGDQAVAASGVAATVESQGREAGCVDWSYRVEPAPRNKRVRMVRLVFDFASRCAREVSVVLAKQTFDGGGGAIYGQPIVLAPRERHDHAESGEVGNEILFDPDRDRWLRFWVHQSERRFRNGVYLDLARCNLKFPPPDPRPPTPPHPACPPATAYGTAGP